MQKTFDSSRAEVSFRELDLGELVGLWDEELTEEARALLFAELEARRFRVKGLAWPCSDTKRESEPKPKPEPKREPKQPSQGTAFLPPILETEPKRRLERNVQRGIDMILVLGVVTLLVAGIQAAGLYRFYHMESYTEGFIVQTVSSTFLSALGVFYLIVYHFANVHPRVGLWIACVVYLAVKAAQILAVGLVALQGWLLGAFVAYEMYGGLKALRALEQGDWVPEERME